jgi:H+-transporting ATPase
MHLDIDHLRTLCVISVVYGSQAITYAVRDRVHLWGLPPAKWLVMSSLAEIVFISLLANRGVAMSSLTIKVLMSELLAAIGFYFVLNFAKLSVFARLKIT